MSFALADPARAAWAAGLAVAGAGLGILAGIDARLAVGLALGVAFVLIALTSVTLGLCLFITLEFLQLSGLGLSVEKMAGGLLALSWLGAMALRRGEAERSLISAHPAFTGLLAFFVGWSLLSALWAAAPDVALASGLRYAQTAVFFLIVYTAVHTRQQALWVVGAFVLSAGLAATLGLVLPSEVSDEGRLEGTYGEPNEYATYLVVGLVLAVTLAGVRAVSAPLRLAAIAAGVLCSGAFLLTGSRAGLVAMGVALFMGVLVGGRRRIGTIVAVVLVAALAATYFVSFAPAGIQQRVFTTESSGRTDLWRIAGRMVEAHPVLGVGAGNFRESSIDYLIQPGVIRRDEYIIDRPNLVHNIYLGALAELGVVGLLLFGGILVFSLLCAVRAVRAFAHAGDRDMDVLARGLLVAIVAILAADFFASEPYSKQLWLLLAMSPGLLAVARSEEPPGDGDAAPSW